jgi:hypothetical protein
MFAPFFRQGPEGWPFNELEAALEAGLTDASKMTHLWSVLLRSDLHVVAQHSSPEDPAPAGGTRLAVFRSGRQEAVMAFSSAELARLSMTEPAPVAQSAAAHLMDHLGEVTLILNPSGPYGKEFLPAEVRAARAGVTNLGGNAIHVADHTPVIFGELASEPLDLIDSVCTACRHEPSIRAVYLCGVCVPGAGDTAPYPLVGIDAEDYAASKALLSRAIGSWPLRHRLPVAYVDMRTPGRFSSHLRAKGKRIYRRGGWLRGLLGG